MAPALPSRVKSAHAGVRRFWQILRSLRLPQDDTRWRCPRTAFESNHGFAPWQRPVRACLLGLAQLDEPGSCDRPLARQIRARLVFRVGVACFFALNFLDRFDEFLRLLRRESFVAIGCIARHGRTSVLCGLGPKYDKPSRARFERAIFTAIATTELNRWVVFDNTHV